MYKERARAPIINKLRISLHFLVQYRIIRQVHLLPTTSNRHTLCRKQPFSLLHLLPQQMSSSPQLPPDSSSSDRVSCPPQLSDESFAKFVIELPLLDESRLSPALVACAAKLRAQFADASSSAQTVLHAMRDAWIAWHHLPISSSGIQLTICILLCYCVRWDQGC